MQPGSESLNAKMLMYVLFPDMARYWSDFDGEYKIDVMSWFIRKVRAQNECQNGSWLTVLYFKGDAVNEAEPIITHWVNRRRVREGRFKSIRVQLYELDTPVGEVAPIYFNRGKHYLPRSSVLQRNMLMDSAIV